MLRADTDFDGVIVWSRMVSSRWKATLRSWLKFGVCDEFGAMLVVDDSHGHGVMGQTGRGTHEHCGLLDQVDILTGTLGKALGGGVGGFVAGSQTAIDLLVQRLAPHCSPMPCRPLAASAEMAIKILQEEPERVERLLRQR